MSPIPVNILCESMTWTISLISCFTIEDWESQPVGSSCPVIARRATQEAGSSLSGRSRRRSLKPKVLTTMFAPEKCSLRLKNDQFWKISSKITNT